MWRMSIYGLDIQTIRRTLRLSRASDCHERPNAASMLGAATSPLSWVRRGKQPIGMERLPTGRSDVTGEGKE
jgi:hypothetical protein